LSAAGLQALVRERSRCADLRIDAVSWASACTMNVRLAERYRDGRQGLNTSMQDAYNLGWKLAAVLVGADRALLDS
jgi:hypothetical protein